MSLPPLFITLRYASSRCAEAGSTHSHEAPTGHYAILAGSVPSRQAKKSSGWFSRGETQSEN